MSENLNSKKVVENVMVVVVLAVAVKEAGKHNSSKIKSH